MSLLLTKRAGIGRPSVAQQAAKTAPAPKASSTGAVLKDAKTEAFVKWCFTSLQISCDKLTPAVFPDTGRGMAASGPIAQEDLLISIPRTSAITLSPKQRCPCTDFVTAEYWAAQPWYVKLGVILLYEKSLGAKSRLSQYIEQLPQSFEHPVLWTPQMVEQLQCPHIIEKVKSQRQAWEGHYQKFTAGRAPGAASISLDQFLWALCAVRSRTFSGPFIGTSLSDRLKLGGFVAALMGVNLALGLADIERTLTAVIAVFTFNVLYEVILSRNTKQYAMAPLMDFLNHSSKVQNEVSLDYWSDRYSVTAGRAFAPGEQVFISYGTEQTSDSLLQYYGFTEPDNPKDTYTLTRAPDWLQKHIAVQPQRLRQIQEAGLKDALDKVSVARTGFPARTLQALRFMLADDARAASGAAAFASPGSDASERRLAELLAAICVDELKALGTSLSEDQSLLASPKAQSKEMLVAVQYRVEKKKILQACLQSLGVQLPNQQTAATQGLR